MSSNIKLKASYSHNNFKNILNSNKVRNVESDITSYGIEYRSAFLGVFNFHVGTNWDDSIFETNIEVRNRKNISFVDLLFDFSDKLSFQVQNERYYFSSLSNSSAFYFTDFDVKYVVKANKLTFSLIGQNVFNTNTFEMINLDDTYIASSKFDLIPRYVMLKMKYRF